MLFYYIFDDVNSGVGTVMLKTKNKFLYAGFYDIISNVTIFKTTNRISDRIESQNVLKY